jgi:hypothetical protein
MEFSRPGFLKALREGAGIMSSGAFAKAVNALLAVARELAQADRASQHRLAQHLVLQLEITAWNYFR